MSVYLKRPVEVIAVSVYGTAVRFENGDVRVVPTHLVKKV